MDKSSALIAALCVAAASAGCANVPDAAAPKPSTTTSTAPSLPPADDARAAIDYFKGFLDIRLPDDAQELSVVHPLLQDFRASTFISSVAAPGDVIDQTCGSIDAPVRKAPPVLSGYPVSEMLESAKVVIDAADYESCEKYDGGRQATVLIPKSAGATTFMLLYHLPYR